MAIQAQELTDFFERWRQANVPPTLSGYLTGFFEAWRQLPFEVEKPAGAENPEYIFDTGALAQWFQGMEQPLLVAKRSGQLCDPWAIAGLKRDEVRNSAVLAWLLNPRGTHGFGDSALRALLGLVADKFAVKQQGSPEKSDVVRKFPIVVGRTCTVLPEDSPDGDLSNRVDIVVDDPGFYLMIEVKIGAQEGVDQLLRYAMVAQKLHRGRPFAILYLTPQGCMPKTAGTFEDKVVAVSWRKLARIIGASLPSQQKGGAAERVTHLLAEQFLRHVSRFERKKR